MKKKYYSNQELERDMDIELAEFCRATASADGKTRYTGNSPRKDLKKKDEAGWEIIGRIKGLINRILRR